MKTETPTPEQRPVIDQSERDVLSDAELTEVAGGYIGQIALLFMTSECMATKPQ